MPADLAFERAGYSIDDLFHDDYIETLESITNSDYNHCNSRKSSTEFGISASRHFNDVKIRRHGNVHTCFITSAGYRTT